LLADKLQAQFLMTPKVETATADATLHQTLVIMDRFGYSQVPIVRDGKPIALLTEVDVRRALLAGRQDRPIIELASPLPRLLEPEAPLSDVLGALQEEDSLLIINGSGQLMGIITYWDVLKLARPFLMVAEIELLLREAVNQAYTTAYGADWWCPPSELDTAEHMLGHTSFWALIEAFGIVRSDLPQERIAALHDIREIRNRIAHHYRLSQREQRAIIESSLRVRDWLLALQPLGTHSSLDI
jgi:CBS domain-containing protein